MVCGNMIDIARLADELNARIDTLAPELLPNGRRMGREFVVGSLAGEKGKSLSIALSGTRRGRWKDFAGGEGGDALDLVAGVLFSGDKRPAIQWAASWLGMTDEARPVPRRPAPPRPTPEQEDKERQAMQDKAKRLFAGSRHRILGTMADQYLRSRAIDLRQLGKQPGRLAFNPSLWCDEVKDYRPAMVAAIQLGGRIVGVHRTYLEEAADPDTGEVVVRKARLECPKKTLGPWSGGCIALWRGASPHGWRDLWTLDPAETGPQAIILTEGIEDALSIAIEDPTRRVAATISLAGLAGVQLPPCITEVVIAADNDAGAREKAALQRAVEAHQRTGRRVATVHAPPPHKDFNDWLRAIRAQEGRAAA